MSVSAEPGLPEMDVSHTRSVASSGLDGEMERGVDAGSVEVLCLTWSRSARSHTHVGRFGDRL